MCVRLCVCVRKCCVLCMKMYANWLLILSQIERVGSLVGQHQHQSLSLSHQHQPHPTMPPCLQPHLRCHRQRQRQRHLSVARNEFKTEASGILLCGLWRHWTGSCVE